MKVVLSSEGRSSGEPPSSDDKIINRAAPRHRVRILRVYIFSSFYFFNNNKSK